MKNDEIQKENTAKNDYNNFINNLSKDLNIEEYKIIICFKKLDLDYKDEYYEKNYSLSKEIVCSFYGLLNSYVRTDLATEELDIQIKRFDEVYIDTAPLIQEDWFLYFIANVSSSLRRRRKKLVILEKTMEELYGIAHNEEKDLDVRLRAKVRPFLIKYLATKGLVKKVDTGSIGIADDHLVALLKKRGKNNNILLITQDRYLSERVVQLGENLNRNIELPHHSLVQRFMSRKLVDDDIVKKVVVCELLKNGDLLRLYICQHCGDSYYDKLFDCGGFVLCSSCYYDIESEKQKKIIDKEKEEQNRKKELKEIEEKRDLEKEILTVSKLIKQKQRKMYFVISLVLLLILVIIFITL